MSVNWVVLKSEKLTLVNGNTYLKIMKKWKYITLLLISLIGAMSYLRYINKESGSNNLKINDKSNLTKEERFEKDEYCRSTYSSSFVRDYEKKLIGKTEDGWEYIELEDIFFSPTRNECMAIYNYNYFDERSAEAKSVFGKIIDLSTFEKRISTALTAENILDSYKLTLGGGFQEDDGRQSFNERLDVYKGE